QRLGAPDGIAASLWGIAQIHLAREEFAAAAPLVSRAYEILCELGRLDGIAVLGAIHGPFLAAAGRVTEALAVLERSRQAFRHFGNDARADEIAALGTPPLPPPPGSRPMTDSVTLRLAGPQADDIAPRVAAALARTFGETPTVHHEEAPAPALHRSLDLGTGLTMGCMVLTLPGTVLAVVSLMDRRKKRGELQELIETLRTVSEGRQVSLRLEIDGRPLPPLADLSADALLEAASASNPPPSDAAS
ncbi:hypothetical protein, partial [Pararhodospirillum oryzae]|uniref:hypothetical protein n=1 Tax=Pararhodospirillum oryzae TaxID=478448 RepID=UPI001478E74A